MKGPGLTDNEVLQRQNYFGLNKLKEQQQLLGLQILINQIKSPLIYILLVAIVIALILGEYREALFIFIVVIINTSLGFYQEYKAESTLSKLKKNISSNAKVIRNNQITIIASENIVPDDLLILEPGIRIAADGYVLEANELKVDEAILTGESEPLIKLTKNETKASDKNIYSIFLLLKQ